MSYVKFVEVPVDVPEKQMELLLQHVNRMWKHAEIYQAYKEFQDKPECVNDTYARYEIAFQFDVTEPTVRNIVEAREGKKPRKQRSCSALVKFAFSS